MWHILIYSLFFISFIYFTHRSALFIQSHLEAFFAAVVTATVIDGPPPLLACDAEFSIRGTILWSLCTLLHRQAPRPPALSVAFSDQAFIRLHLLLKGHLHQVFPWHLELQHNNVLCCLRHQDDVRSKVGFGDMLRKLELLAKVRAVQCWEALVLLVWVLGPILMTLMVCIN